MSLSSRSFSADDSGTSVAVKFRRILVAGLLILAPVAVTIWVLLQIFRFMDGLFAPIVTGLTGMRIPGIGVLLTLAVVLLLGWLSTNYAGRRLITLIESLISRIPIARSVYSGTKGVLEGISQNQAEAFKRVVLIEYPKANIFALAFVTSGASWPQISERTSDVLLVFVPTTPNPTSGFLLLVPPEEAIDLPITVEEGVRMVISGGILLPTLPGEIPARADESQVAMSRSG